MLTIVADQDIPFIEPYCPDDARLIRLPANAITPAALSTADALIIRTVTPVGPPLLRGSPVRFVGAVSAGTNHIDHSYLKQRNIAFACAPGANAQAVVQHTMAIIASLQQQGVLKNTGFKTGLIGVGRIGDALSSILTTLTDHILLFDPPRAAREPDFIATPLAQWRDLDLISLHADLNPSSLHLVNAPLLAQQASDCQLINTARGALVCEKLLQTVDPMRLSLDVYPHEPNLNANWVSQLRLATPHIAGYSAAAKRRASAMVLATLCQWAGLPPKTSPLAAPTTPIDTQGATCWQECVLRVHPVEALSNTMKTALSDTQESATAFNRLRRDYPLRLEFQQIQLCHTRLSQQERRLVEQLGFSIV